MNQQNLGHLRHTLRGFEIVEFEDLNGGSCSLQQSSRILNDEPGSGAVWLGIVAEDRMHLDREQVAGLVSLLQNWLATGSFEQQAAESPQPSTLTPAELRTLASCAETTAAYLSGLGDDTTGILVLARKVRAIADEEGER